MQNNIINRVLGVSGKSSSKRMLGHSNNTITHLGHTNNFTHKIGHSNQHSVGKYISPLAQEFGDTTN